MLTAVYSVSFAPVDPGDPAARSLADFAAGGPGCALGRPQISGGWVPDLDGRLWQRLAAVSAEGESLVLVELRQSSDSGWEFRLWRVSDALGRADVSAYFPGCPVGVSFDSTGVRIDREARPGDGAATPDPAPGGEGSGEAFVEPSAYVAAWEPAPRS